MFPKLKWNKITGPRRRRLLILAGSVVLLYWIMFFLPSTMPASHLDHFKANRNLKYYLDNIKLLIEPSSYPCANLEEVPCIALVSTAPGHQERREVIRESWGKYQPTYFIMGLDRGRDDEALIDNYMEAKQHDDLIVYDFFDDYQNLTLKTGLMLKWTLARCPQTLFLHKVDDDVVVNPWMMKKVMRDNPDGQLIGNMVNHSKVFRTGRYALPEWLYPQNRLQFYLSGPSYLISGDSIRTLLNTAYKTLLINLEDVYYTSLVAQRTKLKIAHDSRMAPVRPWPTWLPFSCPYFDQATVHSLELTEMRTVWDRIRSVGKEVDRKNRPCRLYERYFQRFIVRL